MPCSRVLSHLNAGCPSKTASRSCSVGARLRHCVGPQPTSCPGASNPAVPNVARGRGGLGRRGECRLQAAQADANTTASYLTASGVVDYYELMQVDDDAPPSAIKASYRNLAKVCHPDYLGQEGHNVCILLNEAYEVLMDPVRREAYDAMLEQALKDEEDNFTGQPVSKWCANTSMGKNEDPAESRALFVDEATCIGCKQCVWCAPATFRMEEEYGRSRVFAQWLDKEDDLQAAVDSCPVSCIHWVERDQLPALEHCMQHECGRPNVGIMQAGQGGGTDDVFSIAERFTKQRAERERKAAAAKRYSPAQEAARREAAEALNGMNGWMANALGSMFGSSISDALRANMGYKSGDGRVGQRKRQQAYACDADEERCQIAGPPRDGDTPIPPERALVPISSGRYEQQRRP